MDLNSVDKEVEITTWLEWYCHYLLYELNIIWSFILGKRIVDNFDDSEMHVDLEAKSLFKSKNLGDHRSNIHTATNHLKLRAADEPFLHAFPNPYMAEADFAM